MAATEPIRMLGRYELLRCIAKGGMGEIYLARTRGAGGFEKSCIIKTILPHLAEEEEFVTKFLDEGRTVVQLVHGNIVPVFDMGDEGGEVFIAMEYIAGRDLREVAKRLGQRGETMPVDLALFVASEVCKGLDYAHRKTDESGKSLGIVHRDVSPSNVLISREGEVKLIDFGIARAATRQGKTVSGRIQGKFCYMSPEQASGKALDGRSDIFSAGLVLYELLTGFRPFEGDSDLESLDLVRACEVDPASTLNREVPEEVDAILGKALAKAPDERYPSIDKLQIAMLQYLYSTGSSPTSSDLAAFLAELFPEGLEREELRSARDGSPPRKMSLDEALDFELGKLGSDGLTPVVDPHETTAISSAEVADVTNTKAPRAIAVVETPVEAAELPTAPPRSAPTPRWVPAVAALVLLGAIGGAVYASAGEKATRRLTSDPPGAQISVDGLLIPGAVTPHEVKLDEGDHTITLELDGYETANLRLSVEAGTRSDVPTTRLKARAVTSGPRQFTLHAQPAHAQFFVDGSVLGTPVVTLKPGEVLLVTAQADGCEKMSKHVDYGQGNSGVNFELECEVAAAPDAGQEAPVAAAPAQKSITIRSEPPGATITVNGKTLGEAPVTWSGPANAVLRVTAKKDDQETTISRSAAKISGALNLRLEAKAVAAPPGCLTMSITNPFIATWSVDGQKLGDKQGYKGHRLAAGSHEVRVVNAQEGIDHTERVTVKPGPDCATLLLDGRKLK